MGQKFDLSLWLQDKSRKVVTRDGRNVRIICTDRKTSNSTNVIGLAKNPYDVEQLLVCNTDGRDVYKEIQNDLFFVDEEEELTEFEKAIYQHICTIVTACDGEVDGDKILKPVVKGIAKDLLDLARKELQPEFDKKMDKMLAETDKVVYQKGKQDSLKDLPKWKKANVFVSDEFGLATRDDDLIITWKGYQIKLSDLTTLPKEE